MRKLDYRELMLVYREAQWKSIEMNLNLLTVFRAAQADKDSYQSVVNEMKNRMNSITAGVNESARQSWAELKKRG